MQVSNILTAVVIGLIIGTLGRLVVPGRQRIGFFVTFIIGVGAAILGAYVAGLVNLTDRAPASLVGLSWDWIVLAIQVGFAAVGTAIAAAITHTRIAHKERAPSRARSVKS